MMNTNHAIGALEEQEELVWYASIGSMMNPVGLHSRNIYPKLSVPCIIHDYERKFYAPTGMATIVNKAWADDVKSSAAHSERMLSVVLEIDEREFEFIARYFPDSWKHEVPEPR